MELKQIEREHGGWELTDWMGVYRLNGNMTSKTLFTAKSVQHDQQNTTGSNTHSAWSANLNSLFSSIHPAQLFKWSERAV